MTKIQYFIMKLRDMTAEEQAEWLTCKTHDDDGPQTAPIARMTL